MKGYKFEEYQLHLVEYDKWGSGYLKAYLYSLTHEEIKFLYSAVSQGKTLPLMNKFIVEPLLRYRLYFNNDGTPNPRELMALLHTFEDAKSGRVRESRRTLIKLYPFLPNDWKAQLIAKLIVRKRIDRIIAYRWLQRNWDSSFTRLLIDAWQKYGDAECGNLMLKVIPIERLHSYRDELKRGASYYLYCRCFGVANGEEVDRNRLNDMEYLRVAVANNWTISIEEAESLLHRIASKDFGDKNETTRALVYLAKLGFMDVVCRFYQLQHGVEGVEGYMELQEESLTKMTQKTPALATMIEKIELELL